MTEQETLEMDEVLEKITFYCLNVAREKLEAGEECVPFTVVVEGDQMFEETYPDEDVVTCRANAEANVKSSSTFTTHYAFCYDGFLMTDDGQLDALIVECADRDMEQAYVIGLLYEEKDGSYEFKDMPAYIDSVDTFYDRAAVRAAKAREAVESGDADEVAAAQEELLKRNLGPKEEAR